MISDIIVYSALALAGLYLLCWLSSSSFRHRIETPKYRFLDQLKAHEQGMTPDKSGGEQTHD